MNDDLTGHIPCHAAGRHVCAEPSGRRCVDCDNPAGTRWGPLWCPDCDSRRLARLDAGFKQIAAETRQLVRQIVHGDAHTGQDPNPE